MAKELPQYTLADVAKHNTEADAWIAISGTVYDITKFARMHPGGRKIILEYAGKDATEAFFEMHRADILLKYQRIAVGTIKGFDFDDAPDLSLIDGGLSEVPYGEASFFQGWRSPFWTEEHAEFRQKVRKFVFSNFRESAVRGSMSGKSPTLKDYQLCGKAGFLALRLGPGPHLHGKTFFGVKGEDITYWHEMIAHEEWNHLGCPGWVDGLATGMVIGLPPVMHFGKKEVAERVIPKVLAGDERICLAISEPFAGSDVANIKCTAVKSADGSHYIVNGVKKWITNGVFCDWFVTACRTGGKGIGGISLLLIPRSEGVSTKSIKTSYSEAAGTAYITYEDVKVPAEYLLGEENGGFRCIMHNFNHERWFICAAVIFGSRKITQQCFQWAMQRKAFGKRLIDQPVIRQKIASMIAMTEGLTNWLENITYQMCEMSYEEQNMRLAGAISMLKMQATDTSYYISDEACQIFGGRAITRTGMGQYVERFQRSIKFGAILGGSTEVMADLGVRMAMKFFPENAKL